MLADSVAMRQSRFDVDLVFIGRASVLPLALIPGCMSESRLVVSESVYLMALLLFPDEWSSGEFVREDAHCHCWL
jgi:hypothetical protein